jgi:hypothetical protein
LAETVETPGRQHYFAYLAPMKKTALLFGLIVLTACQQPAPTSADQQDAPASGTVTEQHQPAGKLPGIEIFDGRTYDQQLQKELDQRNALHREYTGVMTLKDAVIRDSGRMTCTDEEGNTYTFSSWPYDKNLRFDADDAGERLHASSKGKRYTITYGLKAFWLEPAAQVVEELVVKKMVPVQ